MAGLVKAKKYDFKDTNMELVGSDVDRAVKKAAAETEPAWKGAGQSVGLQIWRIVKFKVEHLPKEDYGNFYNGDSYIILNTYKDPEGDEIKYDLHFWIGQFSTQDEYGTAAYKTVELDTYLDDKPVQHREVMDNETDLFKSYFKAITLLEGGAESGFRHVKPEERPKRLLHFHGDKKKVHVREVPFAKSSINDGDVFFLDNGKTIYLWHGKDCNKDEKYSATRHLQILKEKRPKVQTDVIDQRDTTDNDKFMALLPDTAEVEASEFDDPEDDFQPTLLRVSDASGSLQMTKEYEGPSIPRNQLDSNDVFIVDTGKACYVWVGQNTSYAEKCNAFAYATNYLQSTRHPQISVTVVKEGQENAAFESAFQ